MAATPESLVKRRVHTVLKAAGAYAVNYIGGQYAANGTPDILACCKGRFFGIEVKAGSNRPTALQIKALAEIEAAGGVALVINDLNLAHLTRCLEDPHAEGLSNYRSFITPAVKAALEGGDAPAEGAGAKAPRVRSED